MKWFIELIKLIIAYFSVKTKAEKNAIVSSAFNYLGDKTVGLEGVNGALAKVSLDLGEAAVNEATELIMEHSTTLFSMTKKELSFVFGKIFKNKGAFSEENYKEFLQTLDEEMLVMEAESNAQLASKVARSVRAKKDLALALKHKLSIVGRFALAKAIGLASHGII